ncbi:hypothetical protein CBR_g36364 [Chara braunii]|uniref:Uncharacterized protein n=1 Tax=Chara braunii TaxID=69332 RepID=A0A388LKJ4_CHABU|nr:hypothetical protein CBR_g36364 [Chara braunii]|eukprot:GBG82834.1 hypothetical protein CBR_g36364 [Chara braunii]
MTWHYDDDHDDYADDGQGLSLTSSGRCLDGVKAYQQALEIDPGFKEALANMGQAYKEHADSQMAAECFRKVLKIDNRHALARRLWGLMRHGLGNHRKAAMASITNRKMGAAKGSPCLTNLDIL